MGRQGKDAVGDATGAPTHDSTAGNSRSPDTELPKVRFSEDLDRPTATSHSSPGSGAPYLTVDTQRSSRISREEGSPSRQSLQGNRPRSSSPSTSRTRDRGFSLRRTILRKSVGHESIELAEAQPSQSTDDTAEKTEKGDGVRKSTAPNVVVSPVGHDGSEHQIEGQEVVLIGLDPVNSEAKERKTYGTLSLPNYESWVRKRTRADKLVKKVKQCAESIQDHDVVRKILRRPRIPPSKDGRHIQLDVSRKTSLIDERTGEIYIDNAIHSSLYTVWNFVPKQVIFQFSKLANLYFLIIAILQFIPGLSPVANYTSIAPLSFFVALCMLKEGYDDYRRYKLDKVENNKEVQVLGFYEQGVQGDGPRKPLAERVRKRLFPERKRQSPSELEVTQSELAIEGSGSTEKPIWATKKWQAIKVGDIVKIQRDEDVPADIVLLHAKGPNGIAHVETMALDGETNLKPKQPLTALAEQCGTLEDLSECHALVVVEDPNIDLYNFEGRAVIGGKVLPLTVNEIILRGSTLRNTPETIGMVINTGEECKIRLNAHKNPRIKAPEMQSMTNGVVIILILFVVILTFALAIAYQGWTSDIENKAWYLDDLHVKFAYTAGANLIIFNNLIPLALYVTLEIIKLGQQVLMVSDIKMYESITNTPMKSNTSTILENLGQVSYVFSDKTGTLTENVMRFRKISVGGYAWLHDFDLEMNWRKEEDKEMASSHTQAMPSGKKSFQGNDSKSTIDMPRRSTASLWKSTARPAKLQAELCTEELLRYLRDRPYSVYAKKAKFFLLSIALCHTCLPELKESGNIEYQADSPDELALVKAAQELGYMVMDRATKTISLSISDGPDSVNRKTEIYEVLDVIEFSSKRRRMSIIVRFPNGKLLLICKGADSAILPRLKLANLAHKKAAEVTSRSSMRRSLEAGEALRRMSEQSSIATMHRPSLTLSRPSLTRNRSSFVQGRLSTSTRLQPIRDELDSWLNEREHDVEMASGGMDSSMLHPNSNNSPRTSTGRLSFATAEGRVDEFDSLLHETVVLDDAEVFGRCFQHIDDFASEGLRTLLYGTRFLEEQEYDVWKKVYLEATTSLADRQKQVENAGEMVEQNLDLAGATAIEDQLQAGVPKTIDKLRRANIKIWMLTGDKRETAINIAYSARICKSFSEVVILDQKTGDVEQRMSTTLLDISRRAFADTVIVIDGQTLSEIDSNETLASLFFELVVLADSVICCRASPSQKASLVQKIRTKLKRHSITLAVGDGANDLGMIQEANVGVGINGKEGLQAARISDYSIAQFRFLSRLLFLHGHWNYVRTAKNILSTFWKELMFYMVQAHYMRMNGYTSTSFFDSSSLTVFNTFFTSLCVIVIGVFEQDLTESTLLAVPELYAYGQRNLGFNYRQYFAWMFMAASEATLIFWVMETLYISPQDDGIYATGDLCFSAAVILINTKILLLEMHNKTIITLAGWTISVAGWWAWNLFLSGVYASSSSRMYNIRGAFLHHFGRDLQWWLTLGACLASVIVLELAVTSIRKAFWPSDIEFFQELQKDKVIRKRLEEAVEGDGKTGFEAMDKRREELKREGEIQELLERPRVMDSSETVGEGR